MTSEYIVSLDIGTSQVRVIVAEANLDGGSHVVGVGTSESGGIRRGIIIDVDQVVQSIRKAVADAERMIDRPISEVYVGIFGNHISLHPSHGVVAVSGEDREIGHRDIDRVLQAARVVALPPEREIIEVIAKHFIVDGFEGIKDPFGMIGVRLEVDALIVTGSKTIVHNLARCISRAGLNLIGMVFLPIAIGDFCLSEDEKNLGVALVDIGGGTTTLSFFRHGHLSNTSVIPIGGEYITNDISIGFRAESSCAEDIKCRHGVASEEFASAQDIFTIKTIGEGEEKTFSQLELAHIIEPRVVEMFQMIHREMRELGLPTDPPGGYVLTGGVVAMSRMLDIARKRLGNSVRIAKPRNLAAKDPSYIGGLATIHYLHKCTLKRSMNRRLQGSAQHERHRSGSFLDRFKNWLSEII